MSSIEQVMLTTTALLSSLLVCVLCTQGERSVVKSVVSTYGVDCRDSQGRTPLMYAVIGESNVQYNMYVVGKPLLCAVVCVCVFCVCS